MDDVIAATRVRNNGGRARRLFSFCVKRVARFTTRLYLYLSSVVRTYVCGVRRVRVFLRD